MLFTCLPILCNLKLHGFICDVRLYCYHSSTSASQLLSQKNRQIFYSAVWNSLPEELMRYTVCHTSSSANRSCSTNHLSRSFRSSVSLRAQDSSLPTIIPALVCLHLYIVRSPVHSTWLSVSFSLHYHCHCASSIHFISCWHITHTK